MPGWVVRYALRVATDPTGDGERACLTFRVPCDAMESWLQDAAALASRQRGLVTTNQLAELGVKPNVISSLVRRGWLTRLRPRTYAFAGAPTDWEQQLLAAVLSAGAGACASHSSSASLWAFRHLPHLTLEVCVPRDRRVRLDGVAVRRATSLDRRDVTTRSRFPATTFERTLVDCSTVLSEFQLSSNLDDGLRRRVASLRALRACVERLQSGPGRRLSVVRSLLDARARSYDPGGSNAERRVLDVLVRAGLPTPLQQYRVRANGKTYFLDDAYPEHMLFIEYYGSGWHGTPSAVVYDSERITAMSTRRWLPLIFTEATPDHVMVERTAAALGCQVGSLATRTA